MGNPVCRHHLFIGGRRARRTDMRTERWAGGRAAARELMGLNKSGILREEPIYEAASNTHTHTSTHAHTYVPHFNQKAPLINTDVNMQMR